MISRFGPFWVPSGAGSVSLWAVWVASPVNYNVLVTELASVVVPG